MTTPDWIVVSIVGTLAAASVAGWSLVVRRMQRGEVPVAFEPREPISWTGAEALLVIAAYLACGLAAAELARRIYVANLAELADMAHAAGSAAAAVFGRAEQLPSLMQGKLAGDMLFLLGVAFIFCFVRPTPAAQLGLAKTGGYDFRVGLAGFVVIVPPVILLQAVLVQFVGKSVHPVLVGLKSNNDTATWIWSALAVVGSAPLVEEFLFRGVIQNWLGRAWSIFAEPLTGPDGRLVPPSAWRLAFAHDGPVVATAGLFGLVHLGNGPDPIPLFFFALGVGYLFRQTGRIWAGWLIHTLLNTFSLLVSLGG